jgi:hypothetical protein
MISIPKRNSSLKSLRVALPTPSHHPTDLRREHPAITKQTGGQERKWIDACGGKIKRTQSKPNSQQ